LENKFESLVERLLENQKLLEEPLSFFLLSWRAFFQSCIPIAEMSLVTSGFAGLLKSGLLRTHKVSKRLLTTLWAPFDLEKQDFGHTYFFSLKAECNGVDYSSVFGAKPSVLVDGLDSHLYGSYFSAADYNKAKGMGSGTFVAREKPIVDAIRLLTIAEYYVKVFVHREILNIQPRSILKKIDFKPQHFDNPQSLITHLNNETKKYDVVLSLDSDGKCLVVPNVRGIAIRFNENLNFMLGLEFDSYLFFHKYAPRMTIWNCNRVEGSSINAISKIDLTRGIFNFMIYCSIVIPSQAGDRVVNLLRSVPIKKEQYGTVVHYVIDSPIYMQMNRTSIREIEILITDAYGLKIPFVGGITQLLLEIKQLL
jgi:hypothetical protein